MGRSQPAAFGGTCVVGRLTCLGERVRLWIARSPDLKGGARLEGPPRSTGTVQGVYLGPGGVGVRQVGLGLQAPGELGQAPARGAACLSVAMGTVAQLRSRLQRGGNRLKMHTSGTRSMQPCTAHASPQTLTYSRAQGLPPTPASNALGHLCNPHAVWASCPGWRLPTAQRLGTALALGGDPGNQELKRDGQPALTAPANNGRACRRGPAPDWECGREGRQRSGTRVASAAAGRKEFRGSGAERAAQRWLQAEERSSSLRPGLCPYKAPSLLTASVSPPAPWSGACLQGQS